MISIIIQILLISVSVAMDAFAVSIGKGLTVSRVRVQDAVKSALWFGGFQMLFPILGYFAASTFSKYVTQFDHWIIFALLVFIGGSIDAFAVGVSLAFMFTKAHMAFAILSIGVVTGLFSAAGLHIGRAFGSRWQKPAQIAGGVVLILLGIKVLLEHLGVIAF